MDITQIKSAVLKQIAAKLEKREQLMAQLEAIEQEIAALQSGGKVSSTKIKGTKAIAGTKKKRGAVKDMIIAELKAAGEKGITVADLAKKLNRNGKNLHAWFHNIGKKITNIKRIGRGILRWE
jgi:chromosome segregation ATPase